MKHFLLFLLFSSLVSCSTSSPIKFETELSSDQSFINENHDKIIQKYHDLENYFGLPHNEKLLIQILPFKRNRDFKNCARIYGPEKIYAHSLESLKQSKQSETNINNFCYEQDSNDLLYTLYHEYVHILTWRYLGHSNLPKWLWEGLAVALSDELKYTSSKKLAIKKLSSITEINFCASSFQNLPPYLIVGPFFYYLEKKKNGILLQLLKLASKNELNREKFMSDLKMKCSVSSEEIIKEISNE
jgi:hypothetical protein